MFGFKPRLPVTEEERLWVDEGFHRLSRILGPGRLQNCQVVLPTDEYFPDPYDKTEATLGALFNRVCEFMQVDRQEVKLEIIPDSSDLMDMLPEYRMRSQGPAGIHFGKSDEEHPLVAITQSSLKDPLLAVATLAHELGHVILLDGGHLQRDAEDMEPMTDLVTVFLGLGLFTANASRRFLKFQDERKQGWSMQRLGYLPETVFAYALARFALERGEEKPVWEEHLSTNLKAYFRNSAEWLKRNSTPRFTA
jgi:hypothetical protein